MMTTVDSSSTSMTANVDPVGLLDMPAEILQIIFKRVSHKDRLNLRLTCRRLREHASHPRVLSLDMMKARRQLSLHAVVNELLTSELTELTVRGKSFTDAALSKLGHHLDTLKSLEVARSSMTPDGVRAWAPQLLKIGCVDFYAHTHLSLYFPTTDGINFYAEDLDTFTAFD